MKKLWSESYWRAHSFLSTETGFQKSDPDVECDENIKTEKEIPTQKKVLFPVTKNKERSERTERT